MKYPYKVTCNLLPVDRVQLHFKVNAFYEGMYHSVINGKTCNSITILLEKYKAKLCFKI